MTNNVSKRLCVRCEHPVDAYNDRCAFCQWEHKDPGKQCMCGYVNKAKQMICKACSRAL